MSSRGRLLNPLIVCLLQAGLSAARSGIKIPIVINITSIHTVTFSFLIIFAILAGLIFLVTLGRVLGGKEELPPDVPSTKYATGQMFDYLTFLAVTLWWAQLIIYTVYVRNVFMLKPRKHFPDTAYVARYTLDQLSDIFLAAATLQLFYYRRRIHGVVIPPFPLLKQFFDACLLLMQLAAIVYTTIFLAFSVTGSGISETRYVNWLTSYHVYTTVYAVGVMNVMVTSALFRKSLKQHLIVDEPCKHTKIIPGSICVHAIFKIVVTIIYSQYKSNSINDDALEVFGVLIPGITYLLAMGGLSFASTKNKADDKKLKELKDKEKQGAVETPDHTHK